MIKKAAAARLRRAACRTLALAVCGVLALTGCGAASAQPASSAPAYSAQLRVGFDEDFPPFSYLGSNGEYVGLDIDLAKEVCRRNNWEFVPVPMSWDEKDTLLENGDIDCIWSCFSMVTREDRYAWTIPYFRNQIVVLTAAGSPVRTFADLAGRRVYVQAATNQSQQILTTYYSLEQSFDGLYFVDDASLAILFLRRGEADACIIDGAAADYYMSQYPAEMRRLDQTLSYDRCAVAFHLGSESRAQTVSETLLAMEQDGALSRIGASWGLQDETCTDAQQGDTAA